MPTTGKQWFAVTVKAENGCEKGPSPWEGSGCAWLPGSKAVRVWPSREGCLAGGVCPAVFGEAPHHRTALAGLPVSALPPWAASGKS